MINNIRDIDSSFRDLQSIVFDSILNSVFITDTSIFIFLLRTGAIKEVILSESLKIILLYFGIPLGKTFAMDKDYLLSLNSNKSFQESSNHHSSKVISGLIDNIKSDHSYAFNKLSERMFGGKRAEAEYIESKESFDQIVYTIVRNRDYKLVREIYFQAIESEGSLGCFSRRFSAGPEKKTLGVVGPISLNKAHSEIFNRIRTADEGQLIKPFYVEGWWICIRVEHREESGFTPEIESVISHQLLDNWLDALCDDILNKAVDLFVSR